MKVADGVYFIEGQDEFIPDSHVYLIGDASDSGITLVDAGLMGKGNYKLSAIEAAGIDPASIKRVIMTHTHLDHIGCLPEILEAIPGAELWVHEEEGNPLEQGDERIVYGMEMFRSMCQSQYGIPDGRFKFKVHRVLADGDVLELGGSSWQVLHIPGHSPGSIALYDAARKILIPGDTVYADYAIGRFDLHGASGSQLRESLARLAELDVDILLPGHNRILTEVPTGYITEVARQWGPYLQ
ncbi:MAG: MBL fold metallo-hydrolase [Deltaproteobacteria bacterium]|nr:MBL fold metallo-hydrolase [Deltaproteobacteria bacterium]MBW2083431.1 MBL fold metallo-hydrolase [Deltaproteobacteria bacterium]